MVFGVFVLGISTILTGINFIVTTHTLRGKGMAWDKLPIFVWTLYATAIIQVLATPVLGITLLLVGVDHCFALGLFDPAVGGDPLLYQHLFWFYSHPAVYIMILPAMGVMAEVVSTFSQKNYLTYGGLVIVVARDRVRRLPHLGPPHVRGRDEQHRRRRSSGCSRCSSRSSAPSRSSAGWARCTAARSR